MRMISYALTEAQLLAGTKRVTRRLGWLWLVEACKHEERPLLRAVRKAMGLGKGNSPVVLGIVTVQDARRERLDAITQADVVLEGFPEMTPAQFVEFFCREAGKAKKVTPETEVTRIEFDFRLESLQERIERESRKGKGK